MEINSKSVKIFVRQRGAVVETKEAKWDVMRGGGVDLSEN